METSALSEEQMVSRIAIRLTSIKRSVSLLANPSPSLGWIFERIRICINDHSTAVRRRHSSFLLAWIFLDIADLKTYTHRAGRPQIEIVDCNTDFLAACTLSRFLCAAWRKATNWFDRFFHERHRAFAWSRPNERKRFLSAPIGPAPFKLWLSVNNY